MTTQSTKVSGKKTAPIAKATTPAPAHDGAASKKKAPVKKEKKEAAPSTTDSTEVIPEEGEDVEAKEKKNRVSPTRESVIQAFEDLIKSVETEVESLRESENKTKGVKFLRTLNKKLKILKNQSARIIKAKRTTTRKNSTGNNSGFLKPVKISKEMAKFTGWETDSLHSRVAVTKYLCDYIKEHNLQNPEDRRQIMADEKLRKLLKYDAKKEGEPLTYFRVQTCLKNHFIKPDETAAVTA